MLRFSVHVVMLCMHGLENKEWKGSHRCTSVEPEFCSFTKKRPIGIGGRHDVDDSFLCNIEKNKALRNGTENFASHHNST